MKQIGASAVEFALVAAVFFLVLFGIFEVGRLIYTHNVMNTAVVNGVRWASVRGTTSDTGTTLADIRTYVQDQSFGVVSSADVTVQTIKSDGTVSIWPTNADPGTIVAISAQTTFNVIIPMVPLTSRTITKQATMLIKR